MKGIAIFHLKRIWEGRDLYEEIKQGKKTSEFRDMTHYWIKHLCERANWSVDTGEAQDISKFLKVHRAWFVVGYPKGLLPRLEADIIELLCDSLAMQLEIKFANVKEVIA
jgi:hypothetical protein